MIVVLNAKFALLFAARANKSMAGKKRPFSGYPGADISLRNNFANSGSCAKVSVPVHIYNSLVSVKMSIDAYCSGTWKVIILTSFMFGNLQWHLI